MGKNESETRTPCIIRALRSVLAEREELLGFLLGDDASLISVKSLVLEKTEGTPCFMEEVVQALVEDGTLAGTAGHYRVAQLTGALQLPPTVQGILAARIDRLAADEKALLQQLAVLGRNFPLSLMREVLPQADDERYRLLATLQRKEFLYEQPAFPEVEYIFKHALTQEVAYNTLLQESRKILHERTARALETLNSANLEDHYPALAHHYRHSGNTAKAVEYLTLAGEQAAQRSANGEAVQCFTAALDAFKSLPDASERARQELALQLSLGASLMATSGYSAVGVEHAYNRARDLCLQVGEPLQIAGVLFGLVSFYAVRGNHAASLALLEQFLPVAQTRQDPALSVAVHFLIAGTSMWMGQLESAQAHYDQAFGFYDPAFQRDLMYTIGQNMESVLLVYGAECLWLRGYPDQALRQAQRGLVVARDLAHPFSIAEALAAVALVHLMARDGEAASPHSASLLNLAEEQGFPSWLAVGPALQGWSLAAHSDVREQREAGFVQLQQGLAALQPLEAEIFVPLFMGGMAEGYARDGQVAAGLKTIDEALALVAKNDERWNEAELYRLKGELALQSSREHPTSTTEKEAEACFEKGIEVARAQTARSWELRAATSLARLWQQQGKHADAHQLLSAIYSWFTEGFDTPDLRDARMLIDELSRKNSGTVY